MTPREYKELYYNLEVPIFDYDKEQLLRWQTVRIEKYLLVVGGDAGDSNIAAIDELLSALKDFFSKKGASITAKIQTMAAKVMDKTFTDLNSIWYYARKAISGKASPEEVQLTLQLALRFKLTTPAKLQDYCDRRIGLDCNGFVGNYLVHGWKGKPWDDDPPGTDYLSNKTIGVIIGLYGTPVKGLKTLDNGSPSYLFGLLNSHGKVIERYEEGNVGHIFISQSGFSGTMGAGTGERFFLSAVESTGGVGLTENLCFIADGADGIYSCKRQSHPEMPALKFRAFQVR